MHVCVHARPQDTATAWMIYSNEMQTLMVQVSEDKGDVKFTLDCLLGLLSTLDKCRWVGSGELGITLLALIDQGLGGGWSDVFPILGLH